MYTKTSCIKIKIKDLLRYIFNKIENNGNADFNNNGENIFLNSLLLNLNKKGGRKVILDIGANIGDYSEMIIKKADKLNLDIILYLFEPTKSCYEILEKRFEGKENIQINNFGISNENSKTLIFYDKEKSGLASLYQRNLDYYHKQLDKQEVINLRRLDEFIDKNKIRHINFIKIDIEGHELQALIGLGDKLNPNFVDYIQFEYGGSNLDSKTTLMEIYSFFEKKGFRVAKLMKNGIEIRDYKPFMENYVYCNYVAISNKILQT
jgi:FkbM family methyltransferase